MKLSSLLPLALASTTLAGAADFRHAAKCGRKNPAINAAIQDFCSKGDINRALGLRPPRQKTSQHQGVDYGALSS